VTRTARGGATCLVASGDGTGSLRRTGACVARTLAWVLRAGVVARERVTAALDGRIAEVLAFVFRGLRTEAFRFVRVVRLGTRRVADREGFGLRDEDFTDNSPGMTAVAMVR
jgi:hypothetical protein